MAFCERGTQSDLSGKPTRILDQKNQSRAVVEKSNGEGKGVAKMPLSLYLR